MASQRAIPAERSAADVLQSPVRGRRHIIAIEVHQLRLRFNAMRIVAGRARRLLIDNMKSMPPILTLRIHRAKTLIAQNAATVMTLVTEPVAADTFKRPIGQQKLSLQNWRVNRAMRSVRSGPAGFCPLIIIVAVRAVNAVPSCQRREQTRNIRIFPHRFHRMIRNVRWIKLETFVRLNNLPIHTRWPAPDTVRVTPKAQLIFRSNRGHNNPGRGLALHAGQSARRIRRCRRG